MHCHDLNKKEAQKYVSNLEPEGWTKSPRSSVTKVFQTVHLIIRNLSQYCVGETIGIVYDCNTHAGAKNRFSHLKQVSLWGVEADCQSFTHQACLYVCVQFWSQPTI